MLALAAAVTGPWWIPTEPIRERLAAELSARSEATVRIEAVSLDWARGFVIEGLTVDPGRGDGPICHVERLAVDMNPFTLLDTGAPAWVDIEGAQLHVALNADGAHNLAWVERLMGQSSGGGPTPPRISIRKSRLSLSLPSRPAPLELTLADAQIATASDRSADITVSASLTQETAPATISLALQTNADRRPAHVTVTFSGLNVAQAGGRELARLYPYALTGRAAGKLTADLDEKGAVQNADATLTLTNLADRHGALADRVTTKLDFHTEGADGATLTANLTAPGATADAKIALTAGLADLMELARAGKPITTESWPYIRSATTGELTVQVTDGELVAPFWPALADEWTRARKDQRGAELTVRLPGEGEVVVDKAELRLGRAGRASVAGYIYDVTAVVGELEAMAHKPARERIRAALGHVTIIGTAEVRDFEAAGRLAPILAEHVADLPTDGAWLTVRADHVGRAVVDRLGPQEAELDVEACLPKHGDVDFSARVTDLQAAWSAALRFGDEPTRTNALACVEHLGVIGTVRVWDLALVERFVPEAREALEGVSLNGQKLMGLLHVNRAGAMDVGGTIDLPTGMEASFAGEIVKPANISAVLTLRGTMADGTTLSDVSAMLTLSGAKVIVTDGLIKCTPPDPADGPNDANLPAPPVRIAASGAIELANVEQLAACFPRAAERLADQPIMGDVTGTFSADLVGGELQRAYLNADLDRLAVDVDKTFTKAFGERADLTVTLAPTRRAGAKYRLDVTADCDYATVNAEAFLAGLKPDELTRGGKASVSGTVHNAATLVSRCPSLADALQGADVSGICTFRGNTEWNEPLGALYVELDATDLAFGVGEGEARRVKPAGTTAEIDLFASAVKDRDKLTLRGLAVTGTLGASRVAVEAEGKMLLGSKIDSWHETLRQWDIAVDGRATIDEPLLDLAPELRPHVKRYGLNGSVKFSADSTGDADDLAVGLEVNAAALSGEMDLAALVDVLGLQGEQAKQLASLGRVRKPADQPARALLTLALPSDPSHVIVDELVAGIGRTRLTASGRVDMRRDGLRATGMALNGKVHLADATELAAFIPAVTPYHPAGAARLDFAYRRRDADDPGTLDAGLTLTKLAGRYRKKDIQLNGRVDLIGAALTPDGRPTVRRLQTAGLKIQAAGSDATILADVSDPTGAATGAVTLLADTIDAVVIEKWLSPTGKLPLWPEGDLTAPQIKVLQAQADATIAQLARLAGEMDIQLHARVNTLRAYDPYVEQIYDLGQVRLTASLHAARFRARYAAALNGGIVEGRLATVLNAKAPVISSRRQVRNVIATDNMAPQMWVFFPGNTPKGTFNRCEDLHAPLRDHLASRIDPRMPIPTVGAARTVTTDGSLKATAATGTMAWLFPGLKATEYRYHKMTAFSTFAKDGTAYNDMVFHGVDHGLYMTGTSDAAGMVDYETGLLTLGSLQSHQWQHKYRQGRVPLFRFQGRLQHQKFTDIKVDYFWPHQSVGKVLLDYNIFYRMAKD